MSKPRIEIPLGKVFGQLTVVARGPGKLYPGVRGVRLNWECLCTCGKTTFADTANLLHGRSRSCGCLRNAAISAMVTTHGKSKTRTYVVWHCILVNAKSRAAIHWPDFESFYADMGERPQRHRLTRKNRKGPYSKDNCFWAPIGERKPTSC